MKEYAEFLKEYNGFSGMNLNVDYLNIKPGELSIRGEEYNPVVREYADGGKLKQCIFSLCLKEARVPVTKESISNIGVLKGFLNWLKIREKEGNYPLPGNGISMTAMTDVNTEKSDIGCNVYSIKIRYLYYVNG